MPSAGRVKDWTPTEWQLFLEWMPADTAREAFRDAGRALPAHPSRNSEVLVAWLVAALKAGYAPAVGRAERCSARWAG